MESRNPAAAEPDVRPPLPGGNAEVEEAAAARQETDRDIPVTADGDRVGDGSGEPPPPPEYPPDTGTGTDPHETLRAFSRPRMTGSPGADAVREGVIRRLETLGYKAKEYPFDFSAFPGRFALPVAGGAVAAFAVIAAVLVGMREPIGALIFLALGAAVAVAIALLAIPMVTRLPWGRLEGRNVLAFADNGRPRYIVMAHLDSKSQLVPLALRAPAIGVLAVGWLVLTGMAFAAFIEPFPRMPLVVMAVVMLVAGLLIGLSVAENKSPGALDNASGLAALLAIAAREREHGDIGFLVTDAEELGLAGARAIAPHLPPVFGVLNLDGLDDDGIFYVMERFGWQKKGLAPHMAAALLGAAAEMEVPVDRRDVPRGIMVDHIPLVEAGLPAMTLMRGTMKSLRRVHRPGDDVDALRGDGVARAVELVCAAFARLREQAAHQQQ